MTSDIMKPSTILNNTGTIACISVFLLLNGCMFIPGWGFSERSKDKAAGRNLGFELVKKGQPANWFFYTERVINHSINQKVKTPVDFDIISDTTDFIEGKKSLKFVVRQCDTEGIHYPGFFKEFDETPGATYKVSFWVKNAGSKFKVILSAVREMGGGPCEVKTISSGENINEWKKYTIERKICDDMKFLRFEVHIMKPGTFQIDGISIEKI